MAASLLKQGKDARIIEQALSFFEIFLRRGRREGVAFYARYLQDSGALDMIEALSSHPSHTLFQKASKLVETYYGFEDEEDVEEGGHN